MKFAVACVLLALSVSGNPAWSQTSPPAAAAAPAPAPAPPPPPYGPPVTLAQARQVLAAAEAEAARNGWLLSFAIVEPSGELVLFQKMDGTGYGGIAVSQAKARTAARFGRPTSAFAEGVAAGRLGVLGLSDIVPVAGGVPLVAGGRTIGAIGVSGASATQDAQVAIAGAAALR